MAQTVVVASYGFSFRHPDSLVVVLRLNCSAANGILANQSNQGLNPRPQHCKADSSPLDCQAGPSNDKHFKKNSS